MADYRELLRKAIDALPENTGANRRAVYEKARSALVTQLRAIEPPLPAREITQHRLNLEDCIRQVEQEATDKLLGRFRDPQPSVPAAAPPPAAEPESEPAHVEEPEFEPAAAEVAEVHPEAAADPEDDDRMPVEPDFAPEPEPEPFDEAAPEAFPQPLGEPSGLGNAPIAPISPLIAAPGPVAQPGSIEDIIAAAEAARQQEAQSGPVGFENGHDAHPDVPEAEPSGEVEAPVLAAEPPMAESRPVAPEARPGSGRGLLSSLSLGGARRGSGLIKQPVASEPEAPATLVDIHGRPLSSGASAGVGEAMSSVREVEPQPQKPVETDLSDSQGAIDRAIETLDRAARGETVPLQPELSETAETDGPVPLPTHKRGTRFAEDDPDERSGGAGALTVFLLIAVLLLAGGGAAGFWAWREGYLNLDAIFAQGEPVSGDTQTAQIEPAPETVVPPAAETTEQPAETPPGAAGAVTGEPMPGEELPFAEPEPENPTPTTDDRLPAEPEAQLPAVTAPDEPGAPDAVAVAEGPQSLLLEEQANGASGAVPYSGSVAWSRGTDELGNPTIEATATIPARNLNLDILIRRNADPSLPASHLMEINFTVSETFVGGTVASLPGILLKNEELVQGTPLTGASARIVGNSFLFALSSASERDVETNHELLATQGWLDVAMVYGTGRRAIMTLEKGEEGTQIFSDVLAAWDALDAAAASAGDEAPEAEEAEAAE